MWNKAGLKKRRPLLWVVSGPSGSGKTTLCKKLIKNKNLNIVRSVSLTTRPKRKGERNYKDYIFLSKSEFSRKIKKREFLEWQEVFGNLYGTSKNLVHDLLSKNKDVLLCIDVKGALQIKKIFLKNSVFIFVIPPDHRQLIKRIHRRARDTKEEIRKRLRHAKFEFSFAKEYDYIIVNDELPKAVKALEAVIIAKELENASSKSRRTC